MEVQGEAEEVVFLGTCENPETRNGKPLQYCFEGEEHKNIIVPYKDAHIVMGAMVDKYSKRMV